MVIRMRMALFMKLCSVYSNLSTAYARFIRFSRYTSGKMHNAYRLVYNKYTHTHTDTSTLFRKHCDVRILDVDCVVLSICFPGFDSLFAVLPRFHFTPLAVIVSCVTIILLLFGISLRFTHIFT